MTAAPPGQRRDRLPALTVQGWFRVVFGVVAVLTVAAAIVVAELVAHGRSVTNELTSQILPAQAQAYRLQGALLDQETGVRGYAITGEKSFLQPYTTGVATEKNAVTQLRRQIGGQPELRRSLSQVETAAAGWRRAYADQLIARAGHGPLSGRDRTLLNQSKQGFDHLRALFAGQNAQLAAAARRDNARSREFRNVQTLTYAVILIVLLIAFTLLVLMLQRAVARPLVQLRAGSRRVTSGDFGHRIQPSGPADIWAVAADVESMRRELAAAVDSARAAAEVAIQQAAELDSSAEELRRSNAELEQFAYVASHDLQEPLRKVASFCQLLEKRYSEQLDDRGRQYIDFAVDGAKRLQVLINDLLAFSRVGRASNAQVQLPLGETLDAALHALGAMTEETGAVIERPDAMPEVMGEPTLLAMVWQNLISNAIKFRAPDRIPWVQITMTEQPGPLWQFCVTDNGIGIAPEFADKVFVIFQRLHGRDAYPGTGIGLAMCKRIIEHHGGEIRLDTSYPDGARICFTLPQLESNKPDDADAPAGAGVPTEGIPA